MNDRTTKVLLSFIAAALWLHLFAPLWETSAQAQFDPNTTFLRQIATSIQSIERGTCSNSTIC